MLNENIENYMKQKVKDLIKQESLIFRNCSKPYFQPITVSNVGDYYLSSIITFKKFKIKIKTHININKSDKVVHSFRHFKAINSKGALTNITLEKLESFCSSISSGFSYEKNCYLYLYDELDLRSVCICFDLLPICEYEHKRSALLKYFLYQNELEFKVVENLKKYYEFNFLWCNSITFREFFTEDNKIKNFYLYSEKSENYLNLLRINLYV